MKDGDSRQDTEIAVFSILKRGLVDIGTSCASDRVHALTELVLLLEEWASKINLTGHRDPLDMARRLVLDAAALNATLPEITGATSLADLGTGAGFPGLPLAILNPHLDVFLVDSRLKRHHFQKAARRLFNLERVHPILGRSDEVDQASCDVVVAQAMTQPNRALEFMAQWAGPGATLALPASQNASAPRPPSGFGQPELREYVVPEIGTLRRLWIIKMATLESD